MKVKDLIEKLSKLEPDRTVEVKVRVHTRRHCVASVTPFEVDWAGIWISLPDNMHVIERKEPETKRCQKCGGTFNAGLIENGMCEACRNAS